MTATYLTATTEHAAQATSPHVADTAAKAETHAGPHVSIKAEPVFSVAGFPIANSMLLSFFVFAFFIAIVAKYNTDAKKPKKSGLFYFVTFALRGIYGLFESALGDKTMYFFPLIGAFFFYILLNNWAGLLPGVGSVLIHHVPLLRANTADLNTTIALALVSVFMVQFYGVKHLGGSYFKKFINFANPISFFVGILEIVSEFSRILSFAFRLFGNIFAGEVLLAVVSFLIPAFVSFPFLMLETFVGLIQAVVFSMLSAILFRLAITSEH
ncbi:F0F1 ATP synthase subunit A [Candidatus Microgenomates bacterium]|nr:F0F1 ATP synthase subunit A [Candidatus Microgenomates bacterium]